MVVWGEGGTWSLLSTNINNSAEYNISLSLSHVYCYIYIILYKRVKFNSVFFLSSSGCLRSLSTPPVILESNYTSELQSSFGIEIKPGKNHNRPGLIIYPSEGFLIAKLWFSHCWRSSLIIPGFSLLWESPWVQQRPNLPWEQRILAKKIIEIQKNLWIFLPSNWPELGIEYYTMVQLILCRILVQKKSNGDVIFLEILQHLPSIFLSCPDCHGNTNNYKMGFLM